ncbi:MAG: T9SS type A sorting domain-containing protein [Chlorobi bacterium]|nr:T9SS type A sorting domain-containing protein [Chlorobiota bacterium]
MVRGDYVTCGSWHDIWLNEGFATYLDGMTNEHNLNDDGVSFDDWKQDRINSIISKPDGSVYVTDTTSVNRIFNGRLSYDKGAMVLHMLRKYIGDDAFFNGITNYLNDLGNGYARTSDLQSHLEQTFGKSLQDFFDDWFYGEGYPIYTIYFSQNQNKDVTVTMNQTQSNNSVDFFNMKIPLKFLGVDKDTVIWFDNNVNGEQFNFHLDFLVTAAIFDPNHDIISGSSTVLKIDTFDKANKVFVIPNPARNKITVTFLEKIIPEKTIICNNTGKILKSYSKSKESNYKFEFDISDLPSGMYYISFYEDGKNITKKFVKD